MPFNEWHYMYMPHNTCKVKSDPSLNPLSPASSHWLARVECSVEVRGVNVCAYVHTGVCTSY
jgi:hypothetical protein